MTLDTLFLLLVTTYLVLVAYRVVAAGRRLAARPRRIAAALTVVLPPALLALLLWAAGEGAVVAAWGRLLVAMTVAGAVVAAVAGRAAARA